MKIDLADAETLRLVKAFCRITDPEARRIVLSIAEAAARGAVVEMESLVELALSNGGDRREDIPH
jgi:hypothetical protein